MDDQLYQVGNKNIPSHIVIDSQERRMKILKELHDESGHKGRESTYHKIATPLGRSEEHTSELQSHSDLVCRLLLEKKKKKKKQKKEIKKKNKMYRNENN